MTSVFNPAIVAITFLWIGFVCAISFMEAGLKFRAPGITLPIGLGIGRLVFGALNKIEWVLAGAIVLNYLMFQENYLGWNTAWIGFAILILIIQTIWALPALNVRAKKIISGKSVTSSSIHKYYLLLEVVKVATLLVYGVHLFD